MSEIWNQQEGQTELTERNISQVKQESKKIREHKKGKRENLSTNKKRK
jgi:restriction endonuclease S subunit